MEFFTRRMQELEVKAAKEVKAEMRTLLDECTTLGEKARAKLAELREATDDRWDAAKAEMKMAWRRMEAALRHATGEPADKPSGDPPTITPGL